MKDEGEPMAAPWIKTQAEHQKQQRSPNAAPVDITPSALLVRLQEMPRPNHKGYPFPRNGDDGNPIGTFAMWVLTQEDVDLCRADAEAYTTALHKRKADEGNAVNQAAWEENFRSALFVEVLFRVLRENDDLSKPLFRSPDEIRHYLSDDEVVHLYEAYSAMQQKFGPLFRVLTEEELDTWIETLAKGADDFPFELCSRGQLVALVVSFASQMRAYQIGAFSSGSDITDGAETTSKTSTPEGEE